MILMVMLIMRICDFFDIASFYAFKNTIKRMSEGLD